MELLWWIFYTMDITNYTLTVSASNEGFDTIKVYNQSVCIIRMGLVFTLPAVQMTT